jgi:uncharacterized membrane protein YkoI
MRCFAYTLLLLIFLTTPVFPVQATQNNAHFLLLAQNNQQSLDTAAQQIKKQTGGRILSAKTVRQNGQVIHHIKVLLPSGKVRVFKVNQ